MIPRLIQYCFWIFVFIECLCFKLISEVSGTFYSWFLKISDRFVSSEIYEKKKKKNPLVSHTLGFLFVQSYHGLNVKLYFNTIVKPRDKQNLYKRNWSHDIVVVDYHMIF